MTAQERRMYRLVRSSGFTMIELLVVMAVIGVLVGLLLPAVQAVRKSSRRMQCSANLRQIGLAINSYVDTHRVYPFGVGSDQDREVAQITSYESRRFSLHSQLLPYLEYEEVFHALNFSVSPFYPDTTGDPIGYTVDALNHTAASTQISVFVCPSDSVRMQGRPWGPSSYRSCNGSTWSGRRGNGIFSQISSTKPGQIMDGLSKTAAFSERVFGDGDDTHVDMESDLFGLAAPWTTESFRAWCSQLGAAEASTLRRHDSNGGLTWLEGNMNWTRYNHFLPPFSPSCKNDLTWNGVAMTANSRHDTGLNLLMGDGSVDYKSRQIDAAVWNALGTVSGSEAVSED